MKKAILILLLIPFAFCAIAQKKASSKKAPLHTKSAAVQPKAIDIIKFFYTAYMRPFVDGSQPSELSSKQSLLRRVYCTARCRDRYQQLMQESDNDPFIKAMDVNVEALKTLQITKDPKHPNDYQVSYTALDKIVINISTITENGKLKIDYIN